MAGNEKAFTFLPVLLLSSLLFLYVSASFLPFSSYRQLPQEEGGKLQAEWNAEAGIWLALEAWKENPAPSLSQQYLLTHGTVTVVLTPPSPSGSILIVHAYGFVSPSFKRDILVQYDTLQQNIVSWQQ